MSADKERIVDVFRRWGYLQAQLDPLRYLLPEHHPELDLSGEDADFARGAYCGGIGADFMHIPHIDRRRWIQERMESPAPASDRGPILDRILRAELLEEVLHGRYPGTKRYSLEGASALIPLLDEILEAASESGGQELMLGMSHRGRLNVMVHIVGKSPADIFAGFEDVDPRSTLGGGDVKYHIGAAGEYRLRDGRTIQVQLVSNPSHLEAVDPVAIGRARARQDRAGVGGRARVLPLLIHGDAAFAGQGVWAETLNFADLNGFSVGGCVHVIVNNLIGFTTPPRQLHSARFAADIAKRQPVPILHVNAEDIDAVVRVGRIAAEYRSTFASDVVVDLIGYRRHGHSEVDDPTISQPKLYGLIKKHPPLSQIVAEQTGVDITATRRDIRTEFQAAQDEAAKASERPSLSPQPSYWQAYAGGCYNPALEVDTGISADEIRDLAGTLTSYPADFRIHPKVKKLLEQRAEMGKGTRPIDFGMAETLAFGSLARTGTPIRLSGQDSRRGTFNQRHAVLVDTESEAEYVPLAHVGANQGRCEIYNSTLSEVAVLGFEYGYSRDYPEALVLWEAQFGDFANGAQVIIDQFISAGEDKWGRLSGVVLLLPHGYEGQGPEHSSARIERFLQLASEDNMQICQPSTAAQYFHVLRRQVLRAWRTPLVVFTPKSMLRHVDASSTVEELGRPRFLPVLPEREVENPQRVLVCTGKICHELRQERSKRNDSSTAIVVLEQLYPFPGAEVRDELLRHATAAEVVWVQEEPANMGALTYVLPRLKRAIAHRRVRSIKRSASASPATGSAKAHELEQKTLIAMAFATR